MKPVHSVFVIGESRTNADNAITKMYGTFYMACEIDDETSEVLDSPMTKTECTGFKDYHPPLGRPYKTQFRIEML